MTCSTNPYRIIACLLALAVSSTALGQRAPRVFLGYYAGMSGLEVKDIPWRQLTHLSHAFLAVDAQGKMVETDWVPSKELTAAGHQQGVKVLLCLGGGKTAVGLTMLVGKKEWLDTYVDKVVELVAQNGYDGVDIDWESPNDRATRSGFVALVSLLRERLNARAKADGRRTPYLLTAMVPCSGHLGKWIDIGALAGRLDWLNVIAYDMSGPWERTAGHHAPLFPSPNDPEKAWRSVSGAVDYWRKERGVASDKIVVGLAMYGRALPVSKPLEPLDPKKREQHGALPFTKVRELAGKGWPAMWDNQSKVPWLRPPDKKPLLVCYDDAKSIGLKVDWARQQSLRGVYFWAIHQDRMADGSHWLLQAANKAWPEEGKNK